MEPCQKTTWPGQFNLTLYWTIINAAMILHVIPDARTPRTRFKKNLTINRRRNPMFSEWNYVYDLSQYSFWNTVPFHVEENCTERSSCDNVPLIVELIWNTDRSDLVGCTLQSETSKWLWGKVNKIQKVTTDHFWNRINFGINYTYYRGRPAPTPKHPRHTHDPQMNLKTPYTI